jgi:hypothetical protein
MRCALAIAALALLSGCYTPLVAAPEEAKRNHDIDWHVESEPAPGPGGRP